MVDDPGSPAQVTIVKDELQLDSGRDGVSVDTAATKNLLLSRLPAQTTFNAITSVTPLALTPQQALLIQTEAEILADKQLILTTDLVDNFHFTLAVSELVPLLLPLPQLKAKAIETIYTEVAASATRSAQEPRLVIEEENAAPSVREFVPPLTGLALAPLELEVLLASGISELLTTDQKELELTLPLQQTEPQAALADTNALGINELIGFGESYYAHSIAGRIHNVALTSERINNTLVAPGAEFSFNKTLGEVSGRTGFQAGYIIQGGRSVLSDGGGVCQVSTTLFRALLSAGLKITRRLPHSYRVTYYELDNDPGFDATVYAGEVDLRFVNDTDHYILVTAATDSKNLYMTIKIYGTSDGRYTEVTNYQKFNYRNPPEPQYIEDPSLAPGQVRQIDWAVAGLQTTFTHTIYNADGSVRSQTDYPSTYRAWSNKYLVGPAI
jgi:vancomycin resistance protein YoaR